MTNKEAKIINLTPHEVTVVGIQGDILMRIPPSGMIARCSVKRTTVGSLNNIPIVKSVMGEVEDMPKPSEGTVYIVSRVVAEALKGVREDIVIPDESVRNSEGQIIGCRWFAII